MSEEQKIIKIISDHLGISEDEVNEDSHLFTDLNAQKIEIADLLMKLEKEFNVQLSADEIKDIETVRDVLDIFKT